MLVAGRGAHAQTYMLTKAFNEKRITVKGYKRLTGQVLSAPLLS